MNTTPAAPENESAVSPYGTGWTRWIRPIVLSLLLILLDELGAFAFLIGAFLILVYLPRSLLAKKYAVCRKERLIRFAIYLAAIGVVLSLIQINKQVAKERAERIIAAVEDYKAANGKYPDRLDQLVPQFIAEIPAKARITFTDSGFRYLAGESHTLMYVTMPPFGRTTYNFETKSWGFIDWARDFLHGSIAPGGLCNYNNPVRITFDPIKRDKALSERGLDFDDAALIFAGVTLEFEDTRKDYGETRVICYGLLEGRMIVVGYDLPPVALPSISSKALGLRA